MYEEWFSEKVYIVEDACVLREEHRIVGSLVGCLPQKPRQNVHLGLPLRLSPAEVTLLKELGVAKLVDGSQPIREPTEAEVESYNQHAEEVYQQQVEVCKEDRLEAIERQKEEILEGKKAKKRKLQEERGVKTEDKVESVEVTIDDVIITPLPRKSSHVQISTEPHRHYDNAEVEWAFPVSAEEVLRYRVFKDLWQRGHFLTPGGKFGGDFLVYPGDPARYHSFYIAVCVPLTQNLSAQELASLGRLGSTVKKTVVLCSLGDDGELSYLSLNWSHIS